MLQHFNHNICEKVGLTKGISWFWLENIVMPMWDPNGWIMCGRYNKQNLKMFSNWGQNLDEMFTEGYPQSKQLEPCVKHISKCTVCEAYVCDGSPCLL